MNKKRHIKSLKKLNKELKNKENLDFLYFYNDDGKYDFVYNINNINISNNKKIFIMNHFYKNK